MYQLHLNLQQRAALNVAISFWNKKEIKDEITKFFDHHRPDLGRFRDEWLEFTKTTLERRLNISLPPQLEAEFIHIVKEIGEKLYYWYNDIEHKKKSPYFIVEEKVMSYVDIIYWTPYGTIDDSKIFNQIWLEKSNLSTTLLHRISCKYVLEDDLDDCCHKTYIGSKIGCIRSRKYRSQHIIAYWKYKVNSDLLTLIEYYEAAIDTNWRSSYSCPIYNRSRSPEVNMFRLSVYYGSNIVMKYFWNKLNEKEKNRNIIMCAHLANIYQDRCSVGNVIREKYIEIWVFLMNQMNIDQKMLFYDKDFKWDVENEITNEDFFYHYDYNKKDAILNNIISMLLYTWPWQELFISVLDDMLKYRRHDSEVFWDILLRTVNKMLEYQKLGLPVENSIYQRILHETWQRIPGFVKRKKASNPSSLFFFKRLMQIWDLSSIQLILDDPEIDDVKDLYISAGRENFIRSNLKTQYEFLERFRKRKTSMKEK